MEHHDEHSETNNVVRDRLLYPMLLPVVCLIITVILIVAIGEFLLVFGDTSWTIGGQHLVAQAKQGGADMGRQFVEHMTAPTRLALC